MYSPTDLILVIIAAFCLYSAAGNFFAWFFRRSDLALPLFGVACLLGTGYALTTLWADNATELGVYIHRTKWQMAFVRSLSALLPWFLSHYAGRKPGWAERSLTAVFLLLWLAEILNPELSFFSHIDYFFIRPDLWGGSVAAARGTLSVFAYALYAAYIAMLAFLAGILLHLRPTDDQKRFWGLFTTFGFSIFAFVHDLQIDLVDKGGETMEPYVFFAFLLLTGGDLFTRRVQAENNYRNLFHNVNDAVFVHDAPTGRLLDVNETAARLYRSTRKEILNADFELLSDGSSRFNSAQAAKRIQATLREGPQVFEWGARRMDGSTFWVEVALRAADLDGRKIVLATVRDVDEKVRARELLVQSEEFNRAIVEGFEGYIAICSEDYRVEYMNPPLARRIGREPGLEPCYRLLHGFDKPCAWCNPVENVTRNHVETLSGPDNRWLDILTTPLKRPGGRISHLCLMRDITERRNAEDVRKELEARIHKAEKLESLGVLAGGTAHDFNNLLTAIIGNADMAADALPEDSEARKRIGNLKGAAQRAAELARQLLAYSGRGRFKTQPLDLNASLRETVQLSDATVPKSIRLAFELDGSRPFILGDPTQVRQVVLNLLTNAVESMEDKEGCIRFSTRVGGPDPSFKVEPPTFRHLPNDQMVMLEVADEGQGMDEETRKRVFEPFYTTKFSGRGLGMAAVLGIIRGHRGCINIESSPGKGTRIQIFLPRATELSSGESRVLAQPGTPAGLVMVVDDDAYVRQTAAGMLRSLGWDVVEMPDGVSTVESLRQPGMNPSFILLDLTMPRLDGRQTLRLIREARPKQPVVMMSGAYARGENDPDLLGEAQGFLAKPFSVSDLKECLSKASMGRG